MASQEEEPTRLSRKLSQEAIALAGEGRWDEAVQANGAIIARFPDDVAAYNRLGRALIELGRFVEAEEAYRKSLDLEPGNTIATKNLERLKSWNGVGKLEPEKARSLGKDFFASTVGKTGIVALTGVMSLERVAEIGIGGAVTLRRRGQQVLVEASEGTVLGELESKHGVRLAKLMQGGNQYSATILATDEGGTQLLVREDYQNPALAGQPSFPPTQADRLYGHPARVSPIETPPIVDEGRKSAALRGLGHGDFDESFGEEDDRSYLEGFTLVDGPQDREGSLD
ncbi:MAG: tetratricopeptide repeat protein [Dehalococcoidia bacterium]|nr:tetratricopeptide repeat protein [Dehalococcoidia bacterium]